MSEMNVFIEGILYPHDAQGEEKPFVPAFLKNELVDMKKQFYKFIDGPIFRDPHSLLIVGTIDCLWKDNQGNVMFLGCLDNRVPFHITHVCFHYEIHLLNNEVTCSDFQIHLCTEDYALFKKCTFKYLTREKKKAIQRHILGF